MNLCRAFQCVKASDLFQASVDAFPSTFHLTVYFAFSVLGTAALAVDKTLGTCCDRADSTCQIQVAFTTLVTANTTTETTIANQHAAIMMLSVLLFIFD